MNISPERCIYPNSNKGFQAIFGNDVDEDGITDLGEYLRINSAGLKAILKEAGLTNSEIGTVMDEDVNAEDA